MESIVDQYGFDKRDDEVEAGYRREGTLSTERIQNDHRKGTSDGKGEIETLKLTRHDECKRKVRIPN